MNIELKIQKAELQSLLAVHIYTKMHQNVDAKDIKFMSDFDREFEYAYVTIDLEK